MHGRRNRSSRSELSCMVAGIEPRALPAAGLRCDKCYTGISNHPIIIPACIPSLADKYTKTSDERPWRGRNTYQVECPIGHQLYRMNKLMGTKPAGHPVR